MPRYVIERDLPGAGDFSLEEFQELSRRSCGVIKRIRQPLIQWVHSYVTQDKMFCIYIAPNEELIREHARLGGFPVSHILEVKAIVDPVTSETSLEPSSKRRQKNHKSFYRSKCEDREGNMDRAA
jgi:cell division inhibitor SulA